MDKIWFFNIIVEKRDVISRPPDRAAEINNNEAQMSAITLKTSIPGPKNQKLLDRRTAAVSAALYQSVPVALARASGSLVDDVDGNGLIDLVGGIGALAVISYTIFEILREEGDQ